MSEDITTYLIKHKNGEETQVDVPSSWKVTFGPAVKGSQGPRNGGLQMPMALRFYENDTKQRAIFTDVESFRDMSINIRVKKKTTQEKDGYMECDGVRKQTRFQAVVEEWVNPDQSNEEKTLPQLPSDSTIFDLDE
jgi:hypothetical protein